MKIYIGGDHYSFDICHKIQEIISREYFLESTYFGSKNESDKINLPDFIKPVCDRVVAEKTLGILACGTGAGVNIGANKVKGIRATLCRKPIDAQRARQKDDANILCLSSRDTDDITLEAILEKWFTTKFDNPKIIPSMQEMDNWRE